MNELWLRKNQYDNCWVGSRSKDYIAIARLDNGWEATIRPLTRKVELSEWIRYQHKKLYSLVELLQHILGAEIGFYEDAEVEGYLTAPEPVDSFDGGPAHEKPSRRRMRRKLSKQFSQMDLFIE